MSFETIDFLAGLYDLPVTEASPDSALDARDVGDRRLPSGWPDDVPEPSWWAELADTGISIRAARSQACPGCGFGASVNWQDARGEWHWSCPSCGRRSDALEGDPATAEAPGPVCRCGSTRFRDVPIHGGRSVRRDCAACGRFLGFPVWYGETRNEAARRNT